MKESDLQNQFEQLKEDLSLAFPKGLPEDHLVATVVKGLPLDSKELFDPETATLWWAGKELSRNEKLKKFIGTNEKTKIVAKLQKVKK